MTRVDTIVALSSGTLPSGVAVVRISGPECKKIISSFIGKSLKPRLAELVQIKSADDKAAIDEGLAIWFPGPHSFTGEDCLELQVHGSRAVISELLSELCKLNHVSLAEPGEFSRRAFENGKMDLTEIEGLSDLIVAETKQQRLQAFGQQQGALREIYDGWRVKLIHLRAMIEAELDFSEEEDVPEEIALAGYSKLSFLISEIETHLHDNRAGEIIRDGFQVVLLGNPNAGKSSLLNALSKRDAAIVTDEPGTTRDIISVDLDIEGFAVKVTDTAGLRASDNKIEQEGIRRARGASEAADMVIWLQDINDDEFSSRPDLDNLISVISKDDKGACDEFSISTMNGHGLDKLINLILTTIRSKVDHYDTALITRQRYRENLETCLHHLQNCDPTKRSQSELISEDLRHASLMLGKITGVIDVEDILDVIFSEFCIGK